MDGGYGGGRRRGGRRRYRHPEETVHLLWGRGLEGNRKDAGDRDLFVVYCRKRCPQFIVKHGSFTYLGGVLFLPIGEGVEDDE